MSEIGGKMLQPLRRSFAKAEVPCGADLTLKQNTDSGFNEKSRNPQ